MGLKPVWLLPVLAALFLPRCWADESYYCVGRGKEALNTSHPALAAPKPHKAPAQQAAARPACVRLQQVCFDQASGLWMQVARARDPRERYGGLQGCRSKLPPLPCRLHACRPAYAAAMAMPLPPAGRGRSLWLSPLTRLTAPQKMAHCPFRVQKSSR